MNAYQKYMAELLEEYGPLPLRQLVPLVNFKLQTELSSLDRYAEQMCHYGNYERYMLAEEAVLAPKGADPDFDVIRSVDVMLKFFPKVIWHRRSRGFVTVRFFVSTLEHDKEISIIPVKPGMERMLSAFVEDKFGRTRCEVVMFLLESKKQMKLLNPNCYCRFALFGKNGVGFYKPGL